VPERESAPLDALRAAWSRLEAPDPTPEVLDEETERAVEWMRSAWHALEAPESSVPAALRRKLLSKRLPGLGRLAAAASILAIGGLALRAFLEPEPPESVPSPDAPRVVVAAAEEDALVLEHGCVRLLMILPEQETESLDGFTGEDDTKENR